jgi:formate hydrogenlyase subunit 3/multisubunit Na+/H+ antiporter MnhD subunit
MSAMSLCVLACHDCFTIILIIESMTSVIVCSMVTYVKVSRGEYAGLLLSCYSMLGSFAILFGLGMLYMLTGTLSISLLCVIRLPALMHKPIIGALILGCATKLPLFPCQG